ncbi:MAG TPA: hypothetical protein VFX79_03625 [Candidatus Saccharimonadales bacterium]|nr:hypothetical protein [Candidatus Saccharimonadales bacterium]
MKSAQEIAGLTIGGFEASNILERNQLFSEYINNALPSSNVIDVRVISSPASLNSVAASGRIARKKYFFKVHIETNSKVEKEYEQAELLASSGWPVYAPVMKSENPKFPLLVYPWTDSPTLFDKLALTYKNNQVEIDKKDLKKLEAMNQAIGRAEAGSFKKVLAEQAAKSPIQMFFARRFEAGGRIDDWYKPETTFVLPADDGKSLTLSWQVIMRSKWLINGEVYPQTLEDTVEEARKSLAYSGEDDAWVNTSHGDDHAGNIFLTGNGAKVFDPAAAGDNNPVILADVKALAHSGFLPMAGMYYDPKLPYSYSYDEEGNTIKVDADFSKSPAFEPHMAIASQIINLRINPALNALNKNGADMKNEYKRFKAALAGCALLTVNIAKLLEKNDKRGAGLLAMAVMLNGLSGFEVLGKIGK